MKIGNCFWLKFKGIIVLLQQENSAGNHINDNKGASPSGWEPYHTKMGTPKFFHSRRKRILSTLPETNSEFTPEKSVTPKENFIFQPLLFRGYLTFLTLREPKKIDSKYTPAKQHARPKIAIFEAGDTCSTPSFLVSMLDFWEVYQNLRLILSLPNHPANRWNSTCRLRGTSRRWAPAWTGKHPRHEIHSQTLLRCPAGT